MSPGPSVSTVTVAAVDLGASGGRVIAGRVSPDLVELHGRTSAAELRERAASCGQVRLQTHLLADPEELLL